MSLTGLSVVIPVYKENPRVVEGLYRKLYDLGCDVIVVDDGGMTQPKCFHMSIKHIGYGGALKAGIRQAKNPIILTMDGDAEHRVEDVEKLYTVFKLITDCAMLVGCRWNKKESPLRWCGRKMINFFASCWSRHLLVDLNSGMRIFRKDLAIGYAPILCDTFSFTTSLTMAMITDNYKVAWFPIDTEKRAYGKSHVKVWRDGLITIKYVFWIGFALRTRRLREAIRRNPIAFRVSRIILGIGLIIYGIIAIFIPGVPGDALCLSGLICISPNLANWCIGFYKKHPKIVWYYAIISTILGIFVFPYIGFKWLRNAIPGR